MNPLWPVLTIPPVPADCPLGPNTAKPIEYAPESGNVWVIEGVVRATVGAPNASLNCQLNSATPPGAVDPDASNVMLSPLPAVTVNVAVGARSGSVSRCRQVWPILLHSSWYQ